MGVRGDMEATLVSHGINRIVAKLILVKIFECADDPNFAQAYAEWTEEAEGEFNDKMLLYWDVIKFLKEKI